MESLLHRHTGPLGWHFMTYIHKGFYKAESEGYDLKCFPLGSRYWKETNLPVNLKDFCSPPKWREDLFDLAHAFLKIQHHLIFSHSCLGRCNPLNHHHYI